MLRPLLLLLLFYCLCVRLPLSTSLSAALECRDWFPEKALCSALFSLFAAEGKSERRLSFCVLPNSLLSSTTAATTSTATSTDPTVTSSLSSAAA